MKGMLTRLVGLSKLEEILNVKMYESRFNGLKRPKRMSLIRRTEKRPI